MARGLPFVIAFLSNGRGSGHAGLHPRKGINPARVANSADAIDLPAAVELRGLESVIPRGQRRFRDLGETGANGFGAGASVKSVTSGCE